MRRRFAGLAVAAMVVGVLGAMLFAWLIVAREWADVPPPAKPIPVAAKPTRPPLPALPGPSGPEEPDPAHPASVYEAGHVAVAEALGLVAIRCWVGPEWDTEDLVGKYHQKISNGWYTNVEQQLVGERGVEKRFELPDVPADAPDWERVDFETLFVVSWRAERPGTAVPCEVHTLERAALRVRVLDPAGKPVSGARVYGCGSSGDSDAAGLAVLEEAYAGGPCALHASNHGDGKLCEATLDVAPLAPYEERLLDLRLDCLDLQDTDAMQAHLDELPAVSPEAPVARLPELSDEEEIARYTELRARGLGEGADDLLDDLIRHRERMIALTLQQEQERIQREERMRKVEVVGEKIRATSDPAEKERLIEEMRALFDEMEAAL